jgi:hypothetical protein
MSEITFTAYQQALPLPWLIGHAVKLLERCQDVGQATQFGSM